MNTTDFIQKLRDDPESVEKILVCESKDHKWYASLFWNDDLFWTNAFCFTSKDDLLENICSFSPLLEERIQYV